MGSCCAKAAAAPPKQRDEILSSKPSAVVPTSSSPTYCESTTPSETTTPGDTDAESTLPRVQLIGDLLCPFTLRVLIALQFKVIKVLSATDFLSLAGTLFLKYEASIKLYIF